MPSAMSLPWTCLFAPNAEGKGLVHLNCFNFILFVGNAFVIAGIGLFGLFGFPTMREVSETYPTLITPVFGVAPTIWAILLGAQMVWAVAQLLPVFRGAALVKDGVRYYYIGVCLCQCVMILTFLCELVYISIFAGMVMLCFLLCIVHEQDKIESTSGSIRDYWILQFPFSVSIGWTVAMILWNLSIVLVSAQVEEITQYYVALISVVAMGGASLMCLISDYIIPLVIASVTVGITIELADPALEIQIAFDDVQIASVQGTAIVVTTVVILATVFCALIHVLYMWGYFRQRQDDETESLSACSFDSFGSQLTTSVEREL